MRWHRIVIILAAMVFCLSPLTSSWGETPAKSAENGFSAAERQWAVQWINQRLSLLMEDGFITRIRCSEDNSSYEVFVSSDWDFLSVEEKKTFLADFSRARQITGHSPLLVVKSNDSGEVVAQVNGRGIFVFGQEGEYFLPSEP